MAIIPLGYLNDGYLFKLGLEKPDLLEIINHPLFLSLKLPINLVENQSYITLKV